MRPLRRNPARFSRIGAALAALACLAPIAVPAPAGASTMAPAVTAASTPDQLFVRQANSDFLGTLPSDADIDRAAAALTAGTTTRPAYLQTLANSPQWVAHVVTGFYTDTLGRQPDQAGLDYWVAIVRNHTLTVAQVAASFYSSAEYYQRAGGTDQAWVTLLYQALLHRQPDSGGLAYWAATTATQGRWAVAYSFYQSLESRMDRVARLYHDLLRRQPDFTGQRYWADIILSQGDIALAANLASSKEYYALATAGGTWGELTAPKLPDPLIPLWVGPDGTIYGRRDRASYDHFRCSDPCTTTTAMTWSPVGIAPNGDVLGDDGSVRTSLDATPVYVVAPAPLTTPVTLVGGTAGGDIIGWYVDNNGYRRWVRWTPGTAITTVAGRTSGVSSPLILAPPPGYEDVLIAGVGPTGLVWGWATETSTGQHNGSIIWDPDTGDVVSYEQPPDGPFVVRGMGAGGQVFGTVGDQPVYRASPTGAVVGLSLPDGKAMVSEDENLNEVVPKMGITPTGLIYATSGTDVFTWTSTGSVAVVSSPPGQTWHRFSRNNSLSTAAVDLAGITPSGAVYAWANYEAVWPADIRRHPGMEKLGFRFAAPGADGTWITAESSTRPAEARVLGMTDDGIAFGADYFGARSEAAVWTDLTEDATVLASRPGDQYERVTGVRDGVAVGFGDDTALVWSTLESEPTALALPDEALYTNSLGFTADGKILGRITKAGGSGTTYVTWASPSAPPVEEPDPVWGTGQLIGETADGELVIDQGGATAIWDTATSVSTLVRGIGVVTLSGAHVTAPITDVTLGGHMVGGQGYWAQPTSLPLLLADVPPGDFRATGVSESGLVVGNAWAEGEGSRAWLFTPTP